MVDKKYAGNVFQIGRYFVMNGHECSGRMCCADVLMIFPGSGWRQGFPSATAHLVSAGFHEGTATFPALVEVRAPLVHFGKLLAHEANDFHAK